MSLHAEIDAAMEAERTSKWTLDRAATKMAWVIVNRIEQIDRNARKALKIALRRVDGRSGRMRP